MKIPGWCRVSSLYGRIFAIFWTTILLVLLTVFAVQKMDPRKPTLMSKDRLNEITKVVERFERRYQHYESLSSAVKEIDRTIVGGRDARYYLVDKEDNIISKESGMKQRALQNFITNFTESESPKQQLFGRFMLAGPFPVIIAGEELTMYAGFKWDLPPPLVLQLFDKPFQMLVVVMLVSTPLLISLAWALSQPARRLEMAAKRVARGEFTPDPKLEKGSVDFRQTGKAFNQMVLSVNNMLSSQQRLLSDISHELRSPLTRLKMANALACRKLGESDELRRIETEADRLERMISELLKLSRMQIDAHQTRENHTVKELFYDMLKDACFEAEQSEVTLNYNALPQVKLNGDSQLLESAVENIVRNAIHYSKQKVDIMFAASATSLTILVDDDGPGVEEHERDEIFRPFYRVSTARDRDSGGAGLGLAIASSAVAQHSGSIRALESPSKGLRVEVILPIVG
jgi:two-component system sensor histidine kinase CpxA